MTEIEELIKQANAKLKQWRPPENNPKLTERTWQELLDDTPYPKLHYGKL